MVAWLRVHLGVDISSLFLTFFLVARVVASAISDRVKCFKDMMRTYRYSETKSLGFFCHLVVVE